MLLKIIKEFQRKNGYTPSLTELKSLTGVAYINSIVHLLNKLEEKNYISRQPNLERSIAPLEHFMNTLKIPIVGSVACGQPLLAIENREGYIPVDKSLVKGNPDDYFFLKAVGDSMNNTDVSGKSIDDGDLVLIKTCSAPNINDKVVALINDEATIKVYRRDGDIIILAPQSTNTNNKPIILNENFSFQGVVKAVFKKEAIAA